MASKFFFLSTLIFVLLFRNIGFGQAFSANDFYLKGKEFHVNGKLNQAIQYYSEAISGDSKHSKALFNRAMVYSYQGKYLRAIEDYSNYLAQNGPDVEVLEQRGNCFFMVERFESALNDLDAATGIAPSSRIFCNKASIFLALKEFDLAKKEIEKAFSVDSLFSHAWALQGEYFFQKLDYQRSIESFEKALSLGNASNNGGNDSELLLNLGGAYLGLEIVDKAIEVLNLSIEIAPISKAFSNRALAFYKGGNQTSAKRDADTAIEIDLSNADAFNILGLIELKKDDFEKAFGYFNTALTWDSKHVDARNNRGQTLYLLQREEEAMADFDVLLAEKSGQSQAKAWYTRAIIRANRQDFAGACDDFQMSESLGYKGRADEFNRAYCR